MLSYLKNRIYSELSFLVPRAGLFIRRLKKPKKFEVAISQMTIRRILKKNDLYYEKSGLPTWWFVCYLSQRNTVDDLTYSILDYIQTNIPKDANLLFTGCGAGGMLIWCGQQGYSRLSGFDYLPNVTNAAKELAQAAGIKANIWQDDGFNPKGKLEQYDVILVLHWIYSAWMGNYGNKTYDPKESTALLKNFLSNYIPHLSMGGLLIIELVDTIADFKEPKTDIYPVRHSADQVARCANELGLTVERKIFNGNYGNQPRMAYFLKR